VAGCPVAVVAPVVAGPEPDVLFSPTVDDDVVESAVSPVFAPELPPDEHPAARTMSRIRADFFTPATVT
jgi:hypothetical protein